MFYKLNAEIWQSVINRIPKLQDIDHCTEWAMQDKDCKVLAALGYAQQALADMANVEESVLEYCVIDQQEWHAADLEDVDVFTKGLAFSFFYATQDSFGSYLEANSIRPYAIDRPQSTLEQYLSSLLDLCYKGT